MTLKELLGRIFAIKTTLDTLEAEQKLLIAELRRHEKDAYALIPRELKAKHNADGSYLIRVKGQVFEVRPTGPCFHRAEDIPDV